METSELLRQVFFSKNVYEKGDMKVLWAKNKRR